MTFYSISSFSLVHLPKSLTPSYLPSIYMLPLLRVLNAFYIPFSFTQVIHLNLPTWLYPPHKMIWLLDSLISNYPFPESCLDTSISPYQLLRQSTIYYEPETEFLLNISKLIDDPLPRAKNSHSCLFIAQIIFRFACTYTPKIKDSRLTPIGKTRY